MPPHPLTNFKVMKYYENESGFNGVYSRDYLPNKIIINLNVINLNEYSDIVINVINLNEYVINEYEYLNEYVINLNEYSDIGTHWVVLYVKNKGTTYFDSFWVEHIPIKFIGYKNVIAIIFRIQEYDSIICGYFCIGFISFVFNGKSLTKYTNLFSPYDFKKNDDIIVSFFKDQ